MLALDPRCFAPMWAAVEALLPARPPDSHPLGCHRRRVSDEVCFRGIVARLITGSSWDVAGRVVGVGETTLRRRRDEWLRAGVFARVAEEALAAYDRVIGLHLAEISIDTSQHKAPMGGSGSGPSHVDRSKLGWKWSIATDTAGIPLGWTAAAANVADHQLLDDTLGALEARGYELEIEQIHLDRGYDAAWIREQFAESGIHADIAARVRRYRRGRKAGTRARNRIRLGARWSVERTNSWLSNFGQLRRSTDRRVIHREAALDLAIAFILAIKLVKWTKHHGNTIIVG